MNASHFAYSLRVALHRVGRTGAAGCVLLGGAAVFYFSTLRPAQEDLTALQGRLERLEARGRADVAVRSSVEPSRMDRFMEFFPPLDTAPRWLKQVYSIAEREKLELLRGTYRVSEDPALPLARYTISLPVRGTYTQIRRFIAATLTEVQIASLEGVVLKRDKVSDSTVEASVILTLHLQAASRAGRSDPREQVAHSEALSAGSP
jgi:hypothetical protein